MAGEKKYRVLNRSSDLVIKVFGKTQAELFGNSAFALFDILADMEKVEMRDSLQLEVEGADRDDLMVNWVRELLYLFQGSDFLVKEVEVQEIKENYVRAEVKGEKFDPDRHEIRRGIRDVAYDQSRMEKTGDQWMAQLIFEL